MSLSHPQHGLRLGRIQGSRKLGDYSTIKDIEKRTGGEIVLGTSTAYAVIKRMVQDGLLEEGQGSTEDPSAGPKRRYYGITDFGRRVARAEGLRITRWRVFGWSSRWRWAA